MMRTPGESTGKGQESSKIGGPAPAQASLGSAPPYWRRPHRSVGGSDATDPARSSLRDDRGHIVTRRAAGHPVDHRVHHRVRRPHDVAGSQVAAPTSQPTTRARELGAKVGRLERRVALALRHRSVPALRVALALVFIWFGALKVSGDTPVGDLVAGVAPWLPRELFVVGLGIFEVLLGVALMVGYRLVWVALVMVLHLAGTFLVFVTEPATAFAHGNPLLVTMAGEFVAKNMVLIAAGLVLVAFSAPHAEPVVEDA